MGRSLSFIGISFLIFLLMHIAPGDPVSLLLGDDATPADIERTRREWGLDRPLMVQYWDFLTRAVTGDFGRSLKFNEPVMQIWLASGCRPPSNWHSPVCA